MARVEVFNKFSPKERRDLSSLGQRRRLRVREYIFHQGDLWPNTLFLVSGQLRWAMLSMSGREYVLFLIEPGKSFWGHTIFDGQPMPASLMAVKPSLVYTWPREVILPFLFRNPEAMWEITKVQAGTMRKARDIIYGLAFQPVAARLARLLLESSADQDSPDIERNVTLSELASRVASSHEVVCRILYQFQADGIIEINRASINLQDLDALKKLIKRG